MSAELATANMEMKGSRVLIGTPGAAVSTTVTNGVSLAPRSPTGTMATEKSATKR
jgi:hypothetical protein